MSIVQPYEEVLPSTYLDPDGFNMVIGEEYSLGDLQEVAFQHPKKCKNRNLIWVDGILHWRNTKVEHDRRHPQLDERVWMVSKRVVSHLHIYDIGK